MYTRWLWRTIKNLQTYFRDYLYQNLSLLWISWIKFLLLYFLMFYVYVKYCKLHYPRIHPIFQYSTKGFLPDIVMIVHRSKYKENIAYFAILRTHPPIHPPTKEHCSDHVSLIIFHQFCTSIHQAMWVRITRLTLSFKAT